MPPGFDNKIFLLPVIGAICLLIVLFLFAQLAPGIPLSVTQVTTTKTDLFTVTGEGRVEARPDIAQINLGFTVNGQNVSQVQSQANQTINDVSAAVKKLGIEDKDIQTSSYNLRPEYDYLASTHMIKGYTVDVSLSIKVRDFAKINQVIDVSTQNGANTIGNLNFTFDDIEKYKSQARKLAIDEAKRKASEIAIQSGISLGKIINVSEGSYDYPRPTPLTAKAEIGLGSGRTPTQIEAGSSEIIVTATLSYETR